VRALCALTAILALGVASSASASGGGGGDGGKTYNNATVNITGGNAAALSACVNYARVMAKNKKDPQSNFCKNFAKARGGNVNLKNVAIDVLQSGSSGSTGATYNNATVNISGGSATAIAACVNYLQGTSTPNQTNVCKNTAVARGGNVNLRNVSITIIQEGSSS
jgi:hypothetical protein